MPSKMSDKRLLTSYTRAKAELSRIDGRVAKAKSTLENIDELKVQAQATIDGAQGDREELEAQLDHLRIIARKRDVDLEAAPESSVEAEDGAEEPPVQVDGEPVAQPGPGTPAFSQGY